MNKKLLTNKLTNSTIKSMIYTIRDQKVMLDFDLAKIYGYELKYFNRQVNNNISRFDLDFRFKLTKNEWREILKCKNFTSSWGGRRNIPYVFTETGIYMLMTVLKGDLAIKQSKILIKTFKEMKDYIIENKFFISNQSKTINLSNVINEHSERIHEVEEKLNAVMDNFIDPKLYKHYLILNGQKIEADIAYQSIYKAAKYSVLIIDDYIDIKTLQLLKVIKPSINVTIISDNKARNNLTQSFINDFQQDTNINIKFKTNNNKIHDRYIVIDFKKEKESIYHCGCSSKDAGNKITTIIKIEENILYKDLFNDLLNNKELIIK